MLEGRWRLSLLAVVAVLAAGMLLAACGDDDGGDGGGGGGGGPIALLLPETKTARYESQDRPNFERKVKEICSDCEIIYSNADQDAAKQQQQAEAALTKGAEVLVLDPVDAASAGAIVTRAKQSDVPVVSYDRLITDADIDYYISFDNVTVGELQAESLSNKLKDDGNASGPIVMINGAPTDNNAKLFKQGAKSGFQKAGVKIAKEFDTPNWAPDEAQQEMEQAITALGNDGFAGVYAANDGTAGGAIAAMKSAGIDPSTRPTTGQDAEVAGLQRILIGEQFMTIYKAYKPEAEAAAELAVALVRGEEPPADLVTEEIDNGTKQVPSVILTPIAVTKDNIQETVIKDGLWKASDLCTGKFASACKDAGVPALMKGASNHERERARARPEEGEQELRPGPGAQRGRLRGP
jgi:D-xylose transport system substrate-binding protein